MKYSYVRDMLLIAAVIFSLVAQAYCGCDNSSLSFNREPMFDDVILTDNRIAVINGTSARSFCAIKCSKSQNCMSFSYTVDRTCLLYSVKFAENAISVPSVGSRHYYFVKEDVIAADCPVDDGFVLMDSVKLCFKFFSEQIKYNEARDNCSQMGYRMIVLDSDSKTTAISDYLLTNTDQTYIFFGLAYDGVKGEFVWDNGNPVSFTKWGTDEPQKPECGILDAGSKVWIARLCAYTKAYFCEKPI